MHLVINKRDIKQNGLTDVNIRDRMDWRIAVSSQEQYVSDLLPSNGMHSCNDYLFVNHIYLSRSLKLFCWFFNALAFKYYH